MFVRVLLLLFLVVLCRLGGRLLILAGWPVFGYFVYGVFEFF
jgi:hypothetical protein